MATATATKQKRKQTKPLSRMALKEARIAIARDVLAQMRKDVFLPTTGNYCELVLDKKYDWRSELVRFEELQAKKDLQDVLQENLSQCSVCAKGALFVSAILKYDNYPLRNDLLDASRTYFNNHDRVMKPLLRYFSRQQLDLIECAFERGRGGVIIFRGFNSNIRFRPNKDKELYYDAAAFGERYNDVDSRLRAIMNNIIRNEGEFIPPKRPKSWSAI